MNLLKMYEMQKTLDNHILDQHPELKGQDNLEWKVLALLVEVSECANEWRGFKKWSKDQQPRTTKSRVPYMDLDDAEFYNPLLEEFVDGIHFILSIGNDLGFQLPKPKLVHIEDTGKMYLKIYKNALMLLQCGRYHKEFYYDELLGNYVGLGKALGFTWNEIEIAYMSKNEINHKRQDQGY